MKQQVTLKDLERRAEAVAGSVAVFRLEMGLPVDVRVEVGNEAHEAE